MSVSADGTPTAGGQSAARHRPRVSFNVVPKIAFNYCSFLDNFLRETGLPGLTETDINHIAGGGTEDTI